MATDDAIRPRFASNLASLASRAALELDDISLDREIVPTAILGLIDSLALEFPPDDGLDAAATPRRKSKLAAILVARRAISDSQGYGKMTREDDVLRNIESILKSLAAVADDPRGFKETHSEEVSKMRSVCVALSRRALSSGRIREDEDSRNRRN